MHQRLNLSRFLGECRLALRDVLNSPNLAASFTISLLDTKRNNTGVSVKHALDSTVVLLCSDATQMISHLKFPVRIFVSPKSEQINNLDLFKETVHLKLKC